MARVEILRRGIRVARPEKNTLPKEPDTPVTLIINTDGTLQLQADPTHKRSESFVRDLSKLLRSHGIRHIYEAGPRTVSPQTITFTLNRP